MTLEVSPAGVDLSLEHVPRLGPRPRCPAAIPYVQLDQWPPPGIAEELLRQCLRFRGVCCRESRMAAPESRALALPDCLSGGPAGAFIVDHEFCHLHPLPDGSIHLTLPEPIRSASIRQGWAEQHPTSRAGILPETLVMVYAPRDPRELSIVLGLVWRSYQFAKGAWLVRATGRS